jgi:hypothetical protein
MLVGEPIGISVSHRLLKCGGVTCETLSHQCEPRSKYWEEAHQAAQKLSRIRIYLLLAKPSSEGRWVVLRVGHDRWCYVRRLCSED